MSSIFGTAQKPNMAMFPNRETEPVETVTEDATDAGRRRKKKLVAGGSQSTRLSGIRNAVNTALKKRLGE